MKILAFDTATMETSCAITEDDKVLASSSVNSTVSHSETLIGMIESMLKTLGISIRDIDMIGVGVGPGSFTGLRISVVLAKVLAKSLGIPVVGVSTLAALSRQVAEDGIVVPVLDARRHRVYTAFFEKTGDEIVREEKDDAVAVDELIERAPEGAVFIGDGLAAYGEELAAAGKDFTLYPAALSKVGAAFIAKEARAVLASEGASNPYALEPNYLRPSQAMREYRRKHEQSHDA
ncbi:MAG: tRNA (adenosine(37)-N6)-threonylcarbamoyltransferase complex dimerization subunit type 1 TsaB [Peptoniphilus sp.]|nr:tRNA (adenosine(37)-N6)-threonylcarbamoyltransferase complex dimerization subunit type 1 TsaB [Peptoniphilus sp.]MDD7363175.1 tRNA (adenosine(37)-N6)-threonylcarbamoyltransferase complex dimerization subunit type 1 TsaB [Bacillota bacterium]MDY6044501.1 tRNA (adenosine(37)-N6)-threonylcarbamoyltransferase complex dimerization subunit type 1 TsaB [Peptoniphilus sp.]